MELECINVYYIYVKQILCRPIRHIYILIYKFVCEKECKRLLYAHLNQALSNRIHKLYQQRNENSNLSFFFFLKAIILCCIFYTYKFNDIFYAIKGNILADLLYINEAIIQKVSNIKMMGCKIKML